MRSIVLLALFLMVLFPMPSLATSCHSPSFEEILARHELIFMGKALSSGETTAEMKAEYDKNKNPDAERDRGLPNAYTDFEVLKLYKGVPGKTIRIFYATHDVNKQGIGIAGDYSVFPYKDGDEMVIYGTRAGGFYTSYRGLCSFGDRNGKAGEALDTLAAQYDALEKLIAQYPQMQEFYAKKIALYEEHKDYTAAVETYGRYFSAIAGSRDKPELRADYGRLLQLAGRFDDALKALEGTKGAKGADTAQQLSLLRLGRAAELAGQKLALASQELSNVTVKDADLSGADLSNAKLNGVKFVNVKMAGADFSGASVQADFTNCDLTNARFGEAKLRGGLEDNVFDKVDFKGAELDLNATRNNKFRGADFTDAKLHIMEGRFRNKDDKGDTGNDFSRAVFKNANVGGIGGSIVAGADFTGASFYSGRTTASQNQGLDLSGQNLDGGKLDSSDFTGGSFKGASLKGASFSGSKLRGISFVGADLTDATFTVSRYSGTTQLQQTDFSGAKIDGVKWEGAIFDCKTKFPQGFDTLAAGLEAEDPACAKQPALGMYEYSKERMSAGNLKPCNGDYHAACIYGLIINHALVKETGGYSSARIHNFQDIAKSLLDAGEIKLAKLLLMRAYAEHVQIYRNRTIGSHYFSLLKRAGIEFSGNTGTGKLKDDKEYNWRLQGRGRGSQREEALALLNAGDTAKTRAFLNQALDKEMGNLIDTHNKIDVLLNYADIFVRLEGALSPELIAELEKRIRATSYSHFERNKDKPQPADYVAEGEKLLAFASSGGEHK